MDFLHYQNASIVHYPHIRKKEMEPFAGYFAYQSTQHSLTKASVSELLKLHTKVYTSYIL